MQPGTQKYATKWVENGLIGLINGLMTSHGLINGLMTSHTVIVKSYHPCEKDLSIRLFN